jgi:oligopeptide/dipeptide ABC transporter ATP-binding protein
VTAPEVLRVRDLRVRYYTQRGTVKAVEDVSFALHQGEKLGLVGESGSGKSTIALALMRLIRQPGRIEGGEVLLGDTNLLGISDQQMRVTRFAKISLVPQGAMNSLNPVMRIKHQIADTIRAHDKKILGHELDARIGELMESVGLRKQVANMYPHELSGGMKQRVCIAMSIGLKPQVIIADEPTSALDVVVQRQIMDTLDTVQAELGAAVILVGHDMGLMAQFVDRVAVMYAGRLVELGPVEDIFDDALHPYTKLLIATLPSLDVRSPFRGIPGIAASPLDPPPGCAFHPRCPAAVDRCSVEIPAYRAVRPARWTACHLAQ